MPLAGLGGGTRAGFLAMAAAAVAVAVAVTVVMVDYQRPGT